LRVSLTVIGVAGGLLLGPLGWAQEQRTGGYLEEVIVTGTKRDVAQQDTPIAISTITANDISKTFANDIRAVADLAPNVTLTNQTGFNALAGGIRGTGTISILTTQDPSVGLLVDEFSLNHVQSQFAELFDLEQVEVYRGPQGTLFGKNSTGGVISITSKRPDLDEFGGDLRVNMGEYSGGADIRKIQAAADIPLIQGQLGLRFAGSYTEEDGYYKNDKDTAVFPNAPIYAAFGVDPALLPPELDQTTRGAGERLGGKKVLAAKTKLLWQPNERYEGYFIWEIVRDDSDSPPGINETPAGEGFLLPVLGFPGIQEAGHKDPFSTGMTQQGGAIRIPDGHRVDIDGYYFNQQLEFDKFTIKSITGYREQEETLPSTYTGEAFLSLFDASRNLEREQFQQELRFVSNFDSPINFVAGGIYLKDDLDFRAYSTVGLTGIIPAFNDDTGSFLDERGFINLDLRNITNDANAGKLKQDRDSLAFYLDGTWELTDRLRLTAGARYTEDEKKFYNPVGGGGPCNQYTGDDGVPSDPSLPFDAVTNCADPFSGRISRAGLTAREADQRKNPLPDSAYRFLVDEKEKWTETTWRVVVDYAFTDDSMGYVSVATGFLSGGFSETCSQVETCLPYDPETNINYEVGYKADLFDKRLRFNVAAFYTEFEDLQRNQVFAFTNFDGSPGQETITLNAGKSNSLGFEVETTWLATDRLQIKGSVGYLDAEYDEFEFDPNPNDATPPVDLSGLDIPFSPKWQVGLEASYDQDLGNGGSLLWIVSGHYQDEYEMSPFDPNAVNTGIARHPTYTQFEDRTLINANVTYMSQEERYYVTLYGKNLTDEEYRVSANSVGALWNFTMYGPPRQWGIELGVNFK
jgi:iron complex outermembrane receptor protein